MARQTRITDGKRVLRLAPIVDLARCLADREDGASNDADLLRCLEAARTMESLPVEAVASYHATMTRLVTLARATDEPPAIARRAKAACKHMTGLIRAARQRAGAETYRKLARGGRLGAGFDVRMFGETRGSAAPRAVMPLPRVAAADQPGMVTGATSGASSSDGSARAGAPATSGATARAKRQREGTGEAMAGADGSAPRHRGRGRIDGHVRSVALGRCRRLATSLSGATPPTEALSTLAEFAELPVDALCVRDSGVLESVEALAEATGVDPSVAAECERLLVVWGELRGGD